MLFWVVIKTISISSQKAYYFEDTLNSHTLQSKKNILQYFQHLFVKKVSKCLSIRWPISHFWVDANQRQSFSLAKMKISLFAKIEGNSNFNLVKSCSAPFQSIICFSFHPSPVSVQCAVDCTQRIIFSCKLSKNAKET